MRLALLMGLGAPRPAATQVGTTTDAITGTVTRPDGQPLVGAIALATSAATQVTRWQSTEAHGQFTILFAESSGQYQLIVRYFGMVPVRLTVVRQEHENRVEANVRMELAALPDPIASILSGRDSLRLSAAQTVQLRWISDWLRSRNVGSSEAGMLLALERARRVLTPYQWIKLSEALTPSEFRSPASPLASVQEAGQPQRTPAPQALSVYTGLSNVYDSNIDHSPLSLESYGVLVTVGGQYRQRYSGTTVELQYDGVFRRYTNTDRWNRPGHAASVSLVQRVASHWAVGAAGEVAINGSAEDRVLRNEYSVQPELEYRFNRSTRLQLYGEYLLKRYPDPLGQNAVDPRVGVRFRQLVGARGSLGLTGRYEYNRADSTRHTYIGWTAGADIASPMWPAGRIGSSVRYRIRRYTSRLVDVGTTEVLRRDGDLVASVTWQQALYRVWEVGLSYRYENYHSNDTRKEFREHLISMTLKRWW
jgi:hypothetical protein